MHEARLIVVPLENLNVVRMCVSVCADSRGHTTSSRFTKINYVENVENYFYIEIELFHTHSVRMILMAHTNPFTVSAMDFHVFFSFFSLHLFRREASVCSSFFRVAHTLHLSLNELLF